MACYATPVCAGHLSTTTPSPRSYTASSVLHFAQLLRPPTPPMDSAACRQADRERLTVADRPLPSDRVQRAATTEAPRIQVTSLATDPACRAHCGGAGRSRTGRAHGLATSQPWDGDEAVAAARVLMTFTGLKGRSRAAKRCGSRECAHRSQREES